MIKKCTKCLKEKPIEMFGNSSFSKDGKRGSCKNCRSTESKLYRENPENKERINTYAKAYRKKNKKKIKECNKLYRRKNKDKIKERWKEYSENNKEKILEKGKKHHEKNKEKINKKKREKYQKNPYKKREKNKKWYENNKKEINKKRTEKRKARYHKDISYKLNMLISNNIRSCLRGGKNGRHWEDLVGYTLKELMNHLKSLWEPWMNWDNYGNPNGDHTNCWHIDHVIPQSLFKFDSYEDEEFKLCWCLNNLQPKEGKANISKQNKYIG